MSNAQTKLVDEALPKEAPRVRILNDQVVNQIAAGEVVERPASVVKELVENSLDAGATEITVSIANGGKSLVEVADNGHGMGKHDALLAIERFGTSKISSAEDLIEIASFGFRGEALPSIASVSEFSLESKAKDNAGVSIQISGGKVLAVAEAERPIGTRIRIKRLFFNTPARRKFLRTDKTEEGQIRATIHDFALAYPQTRFRLITDGKEVMSVVPAESLFLRAQDFKIAGKRPIVIDENFETRIGKLSIAAVLSQPLECVAGSNRLRLIVNGRVVRDKLLLRAVRDGYGNFLRGASYPAGVLSLRIAAAEVDVNVHPQKSEVRFRSSDVIFGSIATAIKRAFERFSLLPDRAGAFDSGVDPMVGRNAWDRPVVSFAPRAVYEEATVSLEASQEVEAYSPNASVSSQEFLAAPQQQAAFDLLGSSQSQPEVWSLTKARYLGQILKLYLLFEGPRGLIIVDMHAAHERLRFYQIKKKLLTGSVASQLLMVPETVELPPESVEQARRLQPMLAKLGIDYDVMEDDCLLVRGIPAVLAASAETRTDAAALLNDMLSLSPGSDWQQYLQNKIDQVVARLACHSSVRSGRVLKPEEVYGLLEGLEAAEQSGLCPHGRPVVCELGEGQLERLFGRVQ